MKDVLIEEMRNGYLLSTSRERMDATWIYEAICVRSYWGNGRTRQMQEEANANSLCFGIYRCTDDRRHETGAQVAFARIVTDFVIFGYFLDVYVDESERGKGLGKWLVSAMVTCMDGFGVSRLMLMSRDARELYSTVGFGSLPYPERLMTRYHA